MRVTEEGFDLYRARCSACHEVDGGIGPRLRREVVAAHQPPGRLFEYLRRTMPYGAPGTLSDDEYWKVVQFLLVSRELADSTKLVRPPASD